MMNKTNWLFFAFFAASIARYLNKPRQSRKIEIKVIEKNKTMIFKGFTGDLLVNWAQISVTGDRLVTIKITAQVKAIIQYVCNLILPILILGKNSSDMVMDMKVITEIIIVGIISQTILSAFLKKSVIYLLLETIMWLNIFGICNQ